MSRKGQKAASGGKKGSGGSGSAGGGAGGGGDDEREDALQAVCLLPLANTPLIEYTLEFLANAGVEDIFVYCGAHTELVEEYIRGSKWSRASSPFAKLEVIRSTSRSVGDAMRDLDHRDLIVGDFLVVSGDVVSNLPLEAALAQHRARRTADKNAIMTMILREAGPTHRTKDQVLAPVFVIDPKKNRCLHYEEHSSAESASYVEIDPDLLPAHSEIEVRNDLIDCSIDICTPDVLALWSDSFDYEVPRKQFLYGVLKDYELNGKTIHTHIVDDHYAARVRNLQAYDAISKDIISRWTYPLCPGSNLMQGHSYRFQRGNSYIEDGVILARSCVVKRRTVIGQGTSIGDGSIVGGSIIGRRCQIGKNVQVEGAYIWDDTVIGDDSDLRQCIVGNEAFLGRRCSLAPGALVSYGVRLGDGTHVAGTSRITKFKGERDGASKDSDPTVVGSQGDGHEFVESDEDDDDRAASALVYNMAYLAVSDDSISTLASDDESEAGLHHHERSDGGSFTTTTSEDGREDDFHHDASSSIFNALQRNEGPDIVQLELQGLRLSTNADYHQVRHAIIVAFIRRIHQLTEPTDSGGGPAATPIGDAVSQVLRKYQMVLHKTVFDRSARAKPDQVDFLLLLQHELARRGRRGEQILVFAAKELYELDVLEEDGFHQWWADERSRADEEMRRVRAQTRPFIEWLENADEDSEEDDDEDDG
ncbi:MAG: hypothetical protein M1837_001238 [Sclerophora amabilis]|nr:MAG: hypothetical protein M1837_001238 [Sclerophora amabilis]